MSSELDKEDIPDMEYADLSDAPFDLRPDLSLYGIEEVERGVCEDSYENRSILRATRMGYQVIYNDNGQPTGNIRVLSPEMEQAKTARSLEDRRIILTDERDKNSDYLTEEALLVEEQADHLIPMWVSQATRTWIRIREARKTDPKKSPQFSGPPARCRKIKSDGVRCMMWTTGRTNDDDLCRVHLGTRASNTSGAVARARERVYQSAPKAVEILEHLMETAESEPVKLKAATELLDRAGVRGGIEIDGKLEVEVRPAAELIMERLNRLQPSLVSRNNEDDIIVIESKDEPSDEEADASNYGYVTVEVEEDEDA